MLYKVLGICGLAGLILARKTLRSNIEKPPNRAMHLTSHRAAGDCRASRKQGGRMQQPIPKRSNRFYDTSRFGQPQIRLYHQQAKGKRSARYLAKCGCCEEKVEIWYSEDGLEIGGVNGALEDWREILLPLLMVDPETRDTAGH